MTHRTVAVIVIAGIAGLALGLALTEYGAPSKADCEAAMRRGLEASQSPNVDVPFPEECQGLPDDELREIFFRLLGEGVEEKFGTRNP